jgi:hypothetical protein
MKIEFSVSQIYSFDCPQSHDCGPGPLNGMVRRRTLEVVECGGRRHLTKICALGIDLGKTMFHLVGLDASGQVVVRKRCSRTQLLAFTGNLQVQMIGMEACSGSHFLGRALRQQGHEVRLMPAQYVKTYVKTNKSDYIDAEAIAEAVQRPRMRFVRIKTEEQLDLQALHRVRERWVMRRTSVVNQLPRPSDASVLRGDAWAIAQTSAEFPVNARQSFSGHWASAAGMYLLLNKGKTITQLLHTHKLKRNGRNVNHNDLLRD